MIGKIIKDNGLSFVVTLLLCFLCLGTAYRYTSIMIEVCLILALGVSWFFVQKPPFPLQKNERFFIFVLIAFFLSALVSFIVGSGWELKSLRNPSMPSLIDLDLPSKYLLGALFFFLFVRLKFKICTIALFYAIGLGGIINGCFAIYEHYVLGFSRIDGLSGIAEMADASALLGIFSLVLFVFAQSSKQRIFYFIAIFMACFASILTGTRGAMLGMILSFIFVGIMIFWKRRELFRFVLFGAIALALAFFVSFVSQNGRDTLRLESAKEDFQKYEKGDIAGNSIGARFEMWKEAIAMFQMAPFFGLSTYEISQSLKEIRIRSGSKICRDAQGRDPRNEAIGNKHNQLLNQAAKKGIVGVIALILVWVASIGLFLPSLREQGANFVFGLLGLCMTFYFLFPNSLTGEPWESNVSFPLICLLICVFWKGILQERQIAN